MQFSNIRYISGAAVAAAALTLAACGGDDDDHGGEDIQAEFCEHAQNGPFQMVTATSSAADAPEATFEHTAITVTLTDYQGMMGGCVHIEADEAGELIFAVSDDSANMVIMMDGNTLTPEKSEAITDCTELASMDTYDVSAGRHEICFGPTSLTSVVFGFEEGSHDHEGDGHSHDE